MIETKPLIKIGASHLITIPFRWIKLHDLDKKEGTGRGSSCKVDLEVKDDTIIEINGSRACKALAVKNSKIYITKTYHKNYAVKKTLQGIKK